MCLPSTIISVLADGGVFGVGQTLLACVQLLYLELSVRGRGGTTLLFLTVSVTVMILKGFTHFLHIIFHVLFT